MDDARRHRRVKKLLSEKLSLSTKLRLKRLVFAPVRWTLRLAARAYNFAGRVGESAEANGLDLRRAWDVRARPRAPQSEAFGASDFLFLARAASVQKHEGKRDEAGARAIKTSVVIPVFNKVEFTFPFLRPVSRECN